MYAARLAAELKKRADVEIFGMGGAQMRPGADVITTTPKYRSRVTKS